MIQKKVVSWIEGRSEREYDILRHQSYRPRATGSLAKRYGVSPQRITQIVVHAKNDLHKCFAREINSLVNRIRRRWLTLDALHEKVVSEFGDTHLTDLFTRIICEVAGFDRCCGHYMLRETKAEVLAYKARLNEMYDDAGLVEKSALRDHFTSTQIRKFSNLLGLVDTPRYIGRRNTGQMRVKLALLNAAPKGLTIREIAYGAGLSPKAARSVVVRLESLIRIDRTHYGVRSEKRTAYTGAFDALVEYVRSHKDGRVDVKRLLSEFPKAHDIKPQTVQQYLSRERFVNTKGVITLSDAPTANMRLRPLENVISGRLKSGVPYWDSPFKPRYLKGFSIASVPHEIMTLFGCEPGEQLDINPISPEVAKPFRVTWSFSTSSRGVIGGILPVLRALKIDVGAEPKCLRFIFRESGVDIRATY